MEIASNKNTVKRNGEQVDTIGNIGLLPLILYLSLIVMEPQSRFPIIGEMALEKIAILLTGAFVILKKNNELRISKISILFVGFYCWSLISYIFSPYENYTYSKYWFENYWKLLVVYFLIVFAIKEKDELKLFMKGFVIISFVYQGLSWIDFLQGGSYVWQQGMKRMIGIWSDVTYGSANAFAVKTLVSVPFGLFCFSAGKTKLEKVLMIAFLVLSFLSILYSGTRGALLGFFFAIAIYLCFHKKMKLLLTVISLAIPFGYFFMPDSLRHRYLDLMYVKDRESLSLEDRMALLSAESRKEGFWDGLALAKKRPILGYGPSASAIARGKELYGITDTGEGFLELHNLYGQVLGETGFIGAGLFVILIVAFYRQIRKSKKNGEMQFQTNICIFLQTFLGLLLFYGLFSHHLFRYYWIILFGLHGILAKARTDWQ